MWRPACTSSTWKADRPGTRIGQVRHHQMSTRSEMKKIVLSLLVVMLHRVDRPTPRARSARPSAPSCASNPAARVAGTGQCRVGAARRDRSGLFQPGAIGTIEQAAVTYHPQLLVRRHRLQLRGLCACRSSGVGQLLRQRHLTEFRRHRRPHGGPAPRHRGTLRRLQRGPGHRATVCGSPAGSPPAFRSISSPRGSGTPPTTW